MFEGALTTDLGQKMTSSNEGIHAANMGGIWQDVVMGFGGVRLYRGCLRIAPHLPDNWSELRYAIHWQGSRLAVTVRPGCVTIHNEEMTLTDCCWAARSAALLPVKPIRLTSDRKTDFFRKTPLSPDRGVFHSSRKQCYGLFCI